MAIDLSMTPQMGGGRDDKDGSGGYDEDGWKRWGGGRGGSRSLD